ncbi:MAG TPA: DUF2442 domain-containing protein [Saprospirales bacterium]|nr:DUF2442 domain-containing protein [Saprospirales bacterium]HAY70544.1 DUF2442 domain-containing protein [Saprospirales bacterium]HRQ28781.1 DUF2442 domain-containing protein [Saprospiraceae bacterium]
MNAIWVTEAKYIRAYSIYLKINDGMEGIVDFKTLLNGKIFQPLKNMDFFKEFCLNPWTLEWPNGADYAPEFLYEKVLELQTAKM